MEEPSGEEDGAVPGNVTCRMDVEKTRRIKPKIPKQLSLNRLVDRSSNMLRENSVELDMSENTFESLRSPRGFIRKRQPFMPLITSSAGKAAASKEGMSSLDLDDTDVELFRKMSSVMPKARDEMGTMVESTDGSEIFNEKILEETEIDMGPMFSTHFAGLSDPDFNVDCGNCDAMEKQVNGLELQLTELRKVVHGAGGLSDESKSPKKQTWTNKVLGDANPKQVREQNRNEMELILTAINFMMRKIDEVRRECDEGK